MVEDITLSPDMFGEFYFELRGCKPYLWQERAARELADGSAWRKERIWSALSAPTGAGKTTLIECFLFALACSGPDAKFPRRLFWVVDRRNVVDQVYLHAYDVARSIESMNEGGLVADVRTRLQALFRVPANDASPQQATSLPHADNAPVQVRLWRGGLSPDANVDAVRADDKSQSEHGKRRDSHQLRNSHALLTSERLRNPLSPSAPAIVCSTVDQVGSRLLFRGYGVSHRSRPIEAALVGTDSIIVLDEAHLSRPFEETATAVAEMQRHMPRERPARPPLQVLAVTATYERPREKEKDRDRGQEKNHDREQEEDQRIFELTSSEREDPRLAQRRAAKRPVTLMSSPKLPAACAQAAEECADEHHRVIGVVANTVADARAVFNLLRDHGDALLVIGPARPLDRARLLDRIPARDKREQLHRPFFVVGTQTLEVGLDIDFDALVSVCAPLPSLVQRLGRLDRAGILTANETPGRAVIVQPPKRCPVYKEATAAAWQYLCEQQEQGPLELGQEQVVRLLAGAPSAACSVAQPEAPVLLPSDVEILAQTSHDPAPDIEVDVLLRGERELELADVQICWRADLRGQPSEAWTRRVAARPPHRGELLSLSPWAVRRWLRNLHDARSARGAARIADVEGLDEVDKLTADDDALAATAPTVIRVPPPDNDGEVSPRLISATDIRPGDVIVLPAAIGGCDEYGWDPSSREPVTDLGSLSQSRVRLLLSTSVGTPDGLLDNAAETLRQIAREEISEQEAYDELAASAREWLARSGGAETSDTPAAQAARWLAGQITSRGRAIRLGDEDDSVPTEIVLAPQRVRANSPSAAVLYDDHARAVESRAGEFAAALNLPTEIARTLQVAARYHDIGKRDRRFQAWLNGGPAADPSRPLAKSERGPGTPLSWAARKSAGWPRYKRHEALSAVVLDGVPPWPVEIDRDLLLYLISVHHGDGRPFRFFVSDNEPVEITVEVADEAVCVWSDMEIPWHEHAHRFSALNERFGAWGLAAIESLLVLADRSVSAEGS